MSPDLDHPLEGSSPTESISCPTSSVCVQCGTEVAGKYCSTCGEMRAAARRYDLKHFAVEAIEHLTHADANVFRTLRLLLFRPGQLTSEFMAGKRKGYLGPVQMFLVINVAFFFLQSFFWAGPYSVPLEIQLKSSSPTGFIHKWVDAKLSSTNLTLEELSREFDHSEQIASKEFLILMVPVFAAVLALAKIRARRFFVEHLVFSLHYYSFLMLVSFALLPVLRVLVLVFRPSATGEGGIWLFLVIAAIIMVYLFLGLRRAYKDNIWVSAAMALGLTIATSLILQSYRLFLFVEVMHSIHG